MPPSPLTSTARRFICRSCVSNLARRPQGQSSQQYRELAHKSNSLPKQQSSETRYNNSPSFQHEASSVRYFEEGRDGSRTEVLQDEKENNMRETFAALKSLEERTGISAQPLIKALEGNPDLRIPEAIFDLAVDVQSKSSALAALEAQNQLLLEQIEKVKHQNDPKNDGTTTEGLQALLKITLPYTKASNVQSPLDYPVQQTLDSSRSLAQSPENGEKHSGQESGYAHNKISLSTIPPEYRGKVQATLKSLDKALNSDKMRKPSRHSVRRGSPISKLWVDYLSCRPGLLRVTQAVPRQFWDALWKVFDSQSVHNLDRLVHMKCVGDDMQQAGCRLTLEQRLVHIEATFMHGGQIQAINDWNLAGRIKWTENDLYRKYVSLGIRMFCMTNQPERAELVADELLNTRVNREDYRILIPIIQAHLLSNQSAAADQAWMLYVKLRLGLGELIQMQDYDELSSSFLKADQANLALQIFTDMMFTGNNTAHLDPGLRDIENRDPNTRSGYSLTKPDGSTFNVESSNSLARLPPKFNNKQFFGSWTKKLIGAGELGCVERVFQMMQDRGMCPSPIHMNGLIGAWLREGTEANREKAEDLAWKMIKARLDFVRERDLNTFASPIRTIRTHGKSGTQTTNQLPVATMETFTILLQNYRRRRKYEDFIGLFEAVVQSKLPVDTRFINELLWIDSKVANSRSWVWQTFNSLMSRNAAAPDYVTYTILWQNLKKQEDPLLGKKHRTSVERFTTSRQLFGDMLQRTEHLRSKQRMPQELYDLIIICFCYSKDIVGIAVALRACQQLFHIYPDLKTAQKIITALARSPVAFGVGEDSSKLARVSPSQRVAEITRIFGALKDRRNENLKTLGMLPEIVDPSLKEEEGLALLLDLLQFAHAQNSSGRRKNTDVPSDVVQTAREMGAPGCIPWLEDAQAQH